MAEELNISASLSKEETYKALLPQIEGLVFGEDNLIANVSNIMAALKQTFNFLWVGVYFVEHDQLVLGPFQGPIACTRIPHGKGVCGTSWAEGKTIIVDDVEAFPGHIACSALSKSEIVLPIKKNGNVVGILDIDSDQLASFDNSDKIYLEKIVTVIEQCMA